jgi:hypothetical protein
VTLKQLSHHAGLWQHFGTHSDLPMNALDRSSAVMDFVGQWSDIITSSAQFLTSEGLACSLRDNCIQADVIMKKHKQLTLLIKSGVYIKFAPDNGEGDQ